MFGIDVRGYLELSDDVFLWIVEDFGRFQKVLEGFYFCFYFIFRNFNFKSRRCVLIIFEKIAIILVVGVLERFLGWWRVVVGDFYVEGGFLVQFRVMEFRRYRGRFLLLVGFYFYVGVEVVCVGLCISVYECVFNLGGGGCWR